jgi:hypothetical protein
MEFANGFAQIQPTLLRRLSGGWLAVSVSGSILRIGVAGDTEDEARVKFDRAVEAWRRLWTDNKETE